MGFNSPPPIQLQHSEFNIMLTHDATVILRKRDVRDEQGNALLVVEPNPKNPAKTVQRLFKKTVLVWGHGRNVIHVFVEDEQPVEDK